MCQRTYTIPTNRGPIEVTKGTFLTYNKRKHQQASHTHNIAPAKGKAKREVTAIKKNTTRPLQTRMKSIAKRLSNLSSLKDSEGGNSARMEEESTWSHIHYAVYSMSLSLSAANFDRKYNRQM